MMSDFEENNSIENSCKTSDDHRISETNNCLQYIKDLEIKVNKIENYINMIRQKRRNRFFYQLRQKKKKSQKPKFRKFWRKIEKKRKFQKLEFEEIFVPDEQDEEISNIDAPDEQDNKRERIFNFEFAEHFTEFVIDPQKSLQENEKLAEFEIPKGDQSLIHYFSNLIEHQKQRPSTEEKKTEDTVIDPIRLAKLQKSKPTSSPSKRKKKKRKIQDDLFSSVKY